MVDFGSDESFHKAEIKLKEHYGISAPLSGIRRITLVHARTIKVIQDEVINVCKKANTDKASQLISQTDGSMVPTVEYTPKLQDKRKHKQTLYKEAKLSLAREPNSLKPKLSGEICDVAKARLHMKYCANLAGLDLTTQIHAVGDGAPWIAEAVDSQFGGKAKYLVDFYHVSEYLALASKEYLSIEPSKWLHAQQQLLKCGHYQQVIKNLESYAMDNPQSATSKCYSYLKKRTHQLHYDEAIKNDLPIGSGEIESAHRYIIQARLKIAGAWWKEDNANAMIALRTHRFNDQWLEYWNNAA